MTNFDTVIYHDNCADGFTAAWAAWKKFPKATFIPANYGDMPSLRLEGKWVLIVDFSYPRDHMSLIRTQASDLRVLDHRKTAKAALEGLDYALFDMDRCGAGITWDELHGGTRPRLIDYVEDRDLWRWKLPNSKEISAWLSSFERTFERWDVLREKLDSESGFSEAVKEGSAILRAANRHVESMMKRHCWIELAGLRVPCINTTSLVSEIVGSLAEKHSFAVGWFQKDNGQFCYSLRSRGETDVSEIAKMFGGGGCKNAAGFTVDKLLPLTF